MLPRVADAACVLWDDLAWVDAERAEGDALRDAIAFAEAHGARVIGADARAEDVPRLERAGFARAWGESALWTRASPARSAPPHPSGSAVYPVSPAEIMELVACDAPRSGARRGRLLAARMAERPHQAFVAVGRKDGAFVGLALATADRIGPLVADDPLDAARLLHAIELAGAPARAIVPAWNPDAERVFEAAGYARAGPARIRMARGALPGRPGTGYALAGWGVG